ncbi:MAG: AMP-binding protein [Acidimicrobiales bacterium]
MDDHLALDPAAPVSALDPTATTLAALVQWSTAAFADSPALRDGDTELSYRELGELSHRAAAAMVALGLDQVDAIAIWAPNCWQWVVVALGAARAGIRLVPVNTRFKGVEAAYVLDTASARMVFIVDGFLGTGYRASLDGHDLPSLRAAAGDPIIDLSTSAFDDFLALGDSVEHREIVDHRSAAVTPDDVAAVMFTSGTTGHPKGVMVRGGAMIRAFHGWAAAMHARQGDPYLIVNPYFHAFGFNGGIVVCLLFGAVNIPFPVYDPVEVMKLIERERVAIWPGPPALYQGLLNHPDLDRYDLSSLRACVTGAASIPVEMVVAMRERLGFETIVTAYGMTETSGLVTHTLADDPDEVVSHTSGRVIDGVEIRVVDELGADVPTGEPGELWVRGYQVTPGYLVGDGKVEPAADGEGWLHTGDVVVMNADGYIDITDRMKDMFIIGGFNAYPAEIERVMVEHPGIGMAAVIGVPDQRLGEVGAAFVVPSPDGCPGEEELIAWCREHMANYKVPRHIWFVDTLPLTASNKVRKPELRASATDRLDILAES